MNHVTTIRLRNLMFRVAPRFAAKLQRGSTERTYLKSVQKNGYILPLPSLVKRSMIRRFANDLEADVLVETGTFKGDTPWELADAFKQIHTIEVVPFLVALARKRLSKLRHVTVHEGDSSTVLPTLLPSLPGVTLFWLDGHCSSGVTQQGDSFCPVFAELQSIFEHSKHEFGIMIDDARFFYIPDSGYPSMSSLVNFISQHAPGYSVIEFNDVIFVGLRQTLAQSSFLPKFLT